MAKGGSKRTSNQAPTIVIRRNEVVEGGHHGGAWKVAYADFVIAMMAFFLLMWLLNATTEAQRKGLADYFSPTSVLSHNSSGTGRPFSGRTAFADGAMISDKGSVQVMVGNKPPVEEVEDDDKESPAERHPPGDDEPARGLTEQPEGGNPKSGLPPAPQPASGSTTAALPGTSTKPAAPGPSAPPATTDAGAAAATAPVQSAPTEAALKEAEEQREKQAFERTAQQIRDAVRNDPALAELQHQLAIDMTPDGLRIQLLDEERKPMFETGSATPDERARLLLQKITPMLARLPEPISIAGHTDAAPYHGQEKSNWELSTERANATRRLLIEAGLAEGRIRSVTGNADRDPLVPSDPLAAANRRIAIVVLRDKPGAASLPGAP